MRLTPLNNGYLYLTDELELFYLIYKMSQYATNDGFVILTKDRKRKIREDLNMSEQRQNYLMKVARNQKALIKATYDKYRLTFNTFKYVGEDGKKSITINAAGKHYIDLPNKSRPQLKVKIEEN